ncbi:MAG: type II secretion system F family protein [Nanoarchaeota archaeon]|nr:type II secretion system F family protein [Nanoarchaeota archaeon]
MKHDSHYYSNIIGSFLEEIRTYESYRKELFENLSTLDKQYQRGDFTYKKYNELKNDLLFDKTKDEFMLYYDSYINSLFIKLEYFNTKLLELTYNDSEFKKLHINKKILSRSSTLVKKLPSIDFEKRYAPKEPPKKDIDDNLISISVGKDKDLALIEQVTGGKIDIKYGEPPARPDYIGSKLDLNLQVPRPESKRDIRIPGPKNLGPLRNLIYALQSKEKPFLDSLQKDDKITIGTFLSKDFFKYLFNKEDKKDQFISKETQLSTTIFTLHDQSVGDIMDEDLKGVLDPYLLEKQVKEIKNLIKLKETTVYKPSSLGYYANISVRKLSIFFIERFPPFFRSLYRALRFSNIKILSSTYINIMFLLTIVSFLITVPLLGIIFSMQGTSIGINIAKTLFVSVFMACSMFFGMYYYPFMMIGSRKRSINSNLPFAIDHMSSIVASGVPPTTMFKLLSASKEYGEISSEMEKVSNYIEVFGYDVLTAIRAVAINTPSEDFKEFFNGLVSTIETGGDLKHYLESKSKDALLHYRLERQKYIESISTYSDLYTGVLIAAPLFFVTALSLISMLGGQVGGLDVSVLMAMGTYLVIPGLNVLFIIFLELNQPGI